MSQSVTYSSFEPSHSPLVAKLLSFYRRWFALETIHNENALNGIGLDRFMSC